MGPLETERLYMRPLVEQDAARLAPLYADAELMRYMGDGSLMDEAQTWRQVAMLVGHQAFRGYSLLAVEEKASGNFIGRIGLFYPAGWPDLEVGWFVDKAFQGKGYATEGGRACMDYAFEVVGAEHVCSVIHPDNTASINVAEKLGETYESRFEVMGVEASVYGIDRKTWEKRRA